METDWLNPEIDPEALRAAYAANRQITIGQALRPELAIALQETLATRVPWSLGFMNGTQSESLPACRWEALSPPEKAAFFEKVHATAAGQFQFVFWF